MILKAAFTIIALLGVLLYKWTNLPGDLNGILTDEKQNGHLVLLDAKAPFDKVFHSHLFRRMYHAGIQDKTWTIIKSLHHNAESCIKWVESTSDCFKVGMAARQGGILRERPFTLKGWGGYVFFLKKYSDSQCCWKKYSDFGGGKKK